MSEIIEELSPAPQGLRAVFYDEDPESRVQDGERVVAIARVKHGARHALIAVVVSPEGELELATDDEDYLGIAWSDDHDAIKNMLQEEAFRRRPELRVAAEAATAKAAAAEKKPSKRTKLL
jgi:hypothetical protein